MIFYLENKGPGASWHGVNGWRRGWPREKTGIGYFLGEHIHGLMIHFYFASAGPGEQKHRRGDCRDG